MTGAALVAAVPSTPAPATEAAQAPGRWLAVAAGVTTAALGAAGVGFGLAGVLGHLRPVRAGGLVPLLGLRLELDPLGGVFLLLLGAVAVPVGVYSIGYLRREHLPRTTQVMLPLFVLAMFLVAAAGSITTFLYGWEAMAIASLVLVLAHYREPSVRRAAALYAAVSQLGFLALLVGLVTLAAAAGGADTFAALARGTGALSPGARTAVLVLTLVGFGSKCGLLPLHAWLPRAHPEAPSPVSALMSAGMVNLGVYGLLRFDLQLLGPGPRWFGVALVLVGGLSALYGALHASTAVDLKRLLACSTIENLGLIVVALGVGVLLRASGLPGLATVALTAALVHLFGHAAFKALAFLAAGSVLAGTGLRDLDRMGGLVSRMPATAVLFGIAALGACGLPLGAGFVGEWLLVQALLHGPVHGPVHGPHTGGTLLALTLPLTLGAVALTSGLAVVAMIKAFGVGFLARPRSVAAEKAREATPAMLAGMTVAALGCVVMAIAPGVAAPALRPALRALPQVDGSTLPRLGTLVRLPGPAGSVSPLWIAVGLLVAAGAALLLARWGARRRPAPVSAPLWACGADGLSARMQYTATSFAEPLQRVFDDVLRPETDVEITHHVESRYLVEQVAYRARAVDAVEERLYRPVVAAIRRASGWVRAAHSGSVHLYLGYGALGLLVVLLVAR